MKARRVSTIVGALVGGIVTICFGVALMLAPQLVRLFGGTPGAAFLEVADPDFFRWVRLLGGVSIIQGLYQVGTFFLRTPTLIGRVIRAGDALLGTLSIPLLLWLRQNPEILPVYLTREGGEWSAAPLPELYNVLEWVLLLIVIGILIGVVVSIVRVFVPTEEDREQARKW